VTAAEIESALEQFEGLAYETARQIVAEGVELELDDIRQLIRIKVWQALGAYDGAHERQLPLRRFVFMCVANLRKDMERRPRRHNTSIDQVRERRAWSAVTSEDFGALADRFDRRYLSVDAEQVFAAAEDELALPRSLTAIERQVIALRMQGRALFEIDRELGLSRAERQRTMRSIREQLDARPRPVAA
jgi:DNA-binding CsgD family transcriptional regulator